MNKKSLHSQNSLAREELAILLPTVVERRNKLWYKVPLYLSIIVGFGVFMNLIL
jgi:hypothetical protein